MLIIEYDTLEGRVIPDGNVLEWADNLAETYNKIDSGDLTIIVSSAIMIDATRLLIKEKKLNHKEVTYKFEEQNIEVDKRGTLRIYPEGFCNTHYNILARLIDWGLKEEN